jgi:hypothetical protein
MASFTLSPVGGAGAQFFDNNGNILTGGKLYTYAAGTTTPLTTYTTPAGNVANTNPIILDSAGRPPQEIWLSVIYSYKFLLKTSTDVLIATYDNIPGLPPPAVTNDASTIYYEQGNTVTAGSFVIGNTYMIASLETTNFVAIGAAFNSVGQVFVATGAGSGTGTAYTSQTVEAKLQQTVSVKDFGAVGNGVADDTAALQAAINYAKTNNKILYVTSGTYLISGLVIYPASYLTFDPNAILKLSANGIAIRTVQSIGAPAPTSGIDGIILENPTIDMDNHDGCGILLECARDALITSPYVYNIGTGTISRNDTFSTDTYPTMGIGIKGITNVNTAVFNRIVLARCMGVDTGVTPTGGVGIWMGGSQSGTSQRANMNRLEQPICKELLYGIYVDFGSDNIISQPEVSACDDGVRVGRLTGGAASSFRNRIVSPYIEESSTGVYLNFRSQNTFVDGLGSVSSTTNPIFDNGVKTSLFTPNEDYEADFACFYRNRVETTAVLFPATQVPSGNLNALDDYQEGTTTAVKVADATSGGNEATTSSTVCRFIKIGKMVTVWASFTNITTTSMTAGNQVFITGLPFTCVASTDWRPPVLVHFGAITTSAGNINGYINEGESYIRLFDMTTSGSASLLVSALNSGTADLYTQVTYEADA